MKELLNYIISSLVENPAEIAINEKTKPDGEIVYEVSVAPGDMGKVIGRQGRIVKSIRAIMKSAAIHDKVRVSVEIVG